MTILTDTELDLLIQRTNLVRSDAFITEAAQMRSILKELHGHRLVAAGATPGPDRTPDNAHPLAVAYLLGRGFDPVMIDDFLSAKSPEWFKALEVVRHLT